MSVPSRFRNEEFLTQFLHVAFDFENWVGPTESRRRFAWIESLDSGFTDWVLTQVALRVSQSELHYARELTGNEFLHKCEGKKFWFYVFDTLAPKDPGAEETLQQRYLELRECGAHARRSLVCHEA